MTATESLQEQLPLSEPGRNLCAVCQEPSGSISAGTGKPLHFDKHNKVWVHTGCKQLASVDLMISYL